MVRIGTPINKPTPQSIVTNFLLLSSFSPLCFLSARFRPPSSLHYSVSLSPRALPFVVPPRPRKANKPSNSSGILRDSAVPASNQQQVPWCSYIPRLVSFRRADVRYFRELLARTYVHAPPPPCPLVGGGEAK